MVVEMEAVDEEWEDDGEVERSVEINGEEEGDEAKEEDEEDEGREEVEELSLPLRDDGIEVVKEDVAEVAVYGKY